ncbi:hypothetical protein [Stenotrophomonas sp.]|uniref:hypothetical protein n=1 Tax=Stenotrophomonas sp. TaxID=69392 RepID=UPI0028AF168F|nr:hypothetical protein [Stenotrophomonas sp.]
MATQRHELLLLLLLLLMLMLLLPWLQNSLPQAAPQPPLQGNLNRFEERTSIPRPSGR